MPRVKMEVFDMNRLIRALRRWAGCSNYRTGSRLFWMDTLPSWVIR